MFTSVTETRKRKTLATAVIYLGVAAFCGLFAGIYTANGFGMSSDWMTFCFVPPAASALIFALLGCSEGWRAASLPARYLWHMGVATITAAMVMTGIFNIAGVSVSGHIPFYWVAGSAMLAAAVITATIISVAEQKGKNAPD